MFLCDVWCTANLLYLRGQNLGVDPDDISVRLSDGDQIMRCSVQSANHTWLICKVPPGAGTKYTFSIYVSDQPAPPSENMYSILPQAELITIGRRRRYATKGGMTVNVVGNNFGFREGEISVLVGSARCSNVKLVNYTHLTVTLPPATGSSLNGQNCVAFYFTDF